MSEQNGTAVAELEVAEVKGLYPKLAEAIADVERIHKDGKNDHFKYTYTSAEQVYKVIRKPLLERGLIVIPSVESSERTPEPVGKGQGRATITRLHIRVVDTASGESFDAFWVGEGQDTGDKSPYKAATGGMKTWLKHLFMLPADDDPEADASTDQPPEPLPYGLDRLGVAADAARLPSSARQKIGGWCEIDENNNVGNSDRLKEAVDLLEAGSVEALMAKIGPAK